MSDPSGKTEKVWSVQVYRDGRIEQTLALNQERMFIGRMSQNHVVLDHPAVSRSHASIILNAGRFFIADQGSQNGTLLNGRAIFQDEFRVGDVVSIGPFELKLVQKGGGPAKPLPRPADDMELTISKPPSKKR